MRSIFEKFNSRTLAKSNLMTRVSDSRHWKHSSLNVLLQNLVISTLDPKIFWLDTTAGLRIREYRYRGTYDKSFQWCFFLVHTMLNTWVCTYSIKILSTNEHWTIFKMRSYPIERLYFFVARNTFEYGYHDLNFRNC